jgi:glycosyltransferase involved in cell wall biosynthesis
VTYTKANAFTQIYKIDWTEGTKFGVPFYWRSTKKQLSRVLRESKPDIVHAHNIFSAKLISEFGIPFVFDDHEYTSVYVRGIAEGASQENSHLPTTKKTDPQNLSRSFRKSAWNILLKNRAIGLWSKWERELLSLLKPTIVTTEKVAEAMHSAYSINGNRIFVVPNLPMEDEAQSLGKPTYQGRLSSVYAGADRFYSAGVYAHRNLKGLTEMFLNNDVGDLVMIGVNRPKSESLACSKVKVKYVEFLPREKMYNEMFKHSIGLMAFKKHWTHRFKSPNKAYEYAHAGLYVMCTSSFTSVIELFNGNCAVFEDYGDLASQLAYHGDNLEELYKIRLKSFEYAKRNLIWEKYEENIFRAYRLA